MRGPSAVCQNPIPDGSAVAADPSRRCGRLRPLREGIMAGQRGDPLVVGASEATGEQLGAGRAGLEWGKEEGCLIGVARRLI